MHAEFNQNDCISYIILLISTDQLIQEQLMQSYLSCI